MIRPMNCALTECASSFSYHGECGLIASGCCARDMLASLAKHRREGCNFPLDLAPGGNPFVNAMVARGLVRVRHGVTHLIGDTP